VMARLHGTSISAAARRTTGSTMLRNRLLKRKGAVVPSWTPASEEGGDLLISEAYGASEPLRLGEREQTTRGKVP
jgi:hypothetical protein